MLQRLLTLLLILYLSSVVFAPPISESMRVDDLILVFAALLSILPRLRSTKSSNASLIMTISVFVYLILLIMLLSTLLAGFYSQYEYGGLIKELLRIAKYILVIFLALSIEEKKYRRFVTYWVIGLGILVVATQLAQYAGGMNFNQKFAQFYGGSHQFNVALSPFSREQGFFHAGGPFGNPNVASSFLIIPFVMSLLYVFRKLDKSPDGATYQGKWRIVFVITTFFIFIGILLTDSRAAIVTLPVMMLFFLYVGTSNKGYVISFVTVIMLLMILLLIFPSIMNNGPILTRINEGIGDGGSWVIKMTQFRNGVQEMSDHRYWWGFGAGAGPHVDFELAQIVIWYGLPGLIVYLLFWIGMMVGVIKYREHFRGWQALVTIIIAFFLVNFSQSTFLNVRVFPIFIVILLMNANHENLVEGRQKAQVASSPNSLPKTV